MIGKNTFSCYNHLDVCPETKFFSLKNRYNESLGSGPHPPTKRGHFSIFSVSVHIFFKLSSHHSIIIFFFYLVGFNMFNALFAKSLDFSPTVIWTSGVTGRLLRIPFVGVFLCTKVYFLSISNQNYLRKIKCICSFRYCQQS